MPLDEDAIRDACKKIKGKVDSGSYRCFSHMIPDQERRRAVEIIIEELGDIHKTLSNTYSININACRRENSTILNASVINMNRGQ